MYIEAFMEIHNWYFRKLVYKIYNIIKLEKNLILKLENFLNLSIQ